MRESLERIGRFDPQRARERFLSGFRAQHTRHILIDGQRAGFVVVRPDGDGLQLDQLYIDSRFQNWGVGGNVLATIFAEADAKRVPLRVGALRGSDSNRFYLRRGFALAKEDEWTTIMCARHSRQTETEERTHDRLRGCASEVHE